MDGEIGFESTKDEGSTFWIDLSSSEPMDTRRISAVQQIVLSVLHPNIYLDVIRMRRRALNSKKD